MSQHQPLLRYLGAVLIAFAMPVSPVFANEDGPVIYEVEKGDTLFGLAKQYMKSHAAAREVQRINQIRNPRRLPISKRLSVPRRLLRYNQVVLTVSDFSGPVLVNGAVPQRGTKLTEGQDISTGRNGFITFRSDFGARFTMPSNSTMRLTKARRYLMNGVLDVDFTVLSGRGGVNSPSLKDQDTLRLRTPKATTAVRGTDFRTAYSEADERSITEVIEGSVNVAAGTETRTTGAGFGIASTDEGIGAQEALLPPVEFVRPGKVQTDDPLDFTILPQEKAAAYRVQIARDLNFSDILSEAVVTGTDVSFDSLKDGNYSIRARGISASGIEGNSETFVFRRKRLGVTSSSERSDQIDGFLFKWSAIGEGESTFAFQLWAKDSPQSMLVDETGLSETALVLTDLDVGSYSWRVGVMQSEAEGLLKVWGEENSFVISE